MAAIFGSCKDKFVTWEKGFDENGCAIVTFIEADPKADCPPDTCDVPLGPFVKGLSINANSQTLVAGDTQLQTFINYVPYDQGTHVPGPLLGDGTEANPLQVPVKPCNFEFIQYDPSIHVEGQPVQGTGTGEDPWLIPAKECNFEYIPFESVVHDAGPIEGDGTSANPWQIPVQEVNFVYTAFDPAVHDAGPVEGDGTSANPWQIPVKECNFDYVAYNPAIHDLGTIEGTGTPADPWQIPLFELDTDMKVCAVRLVNTPVNGNNIYSFEYDICDINGNVVNTLVANNVTVPTFINKEGVAQTGEIQVMQHVDFVDRGNTANEAVHLFGENIAGECEAYRPTPHEFAYVPYEEATHDEGPIEGNGTVEDPWQVPFTPPKECNFVYVDFDPELHGETDSGDSAIVGDGTVANPWQIPRPCCEVGCDPITETCNITAATLTGPADGGGEQPIRLSAVEVACGQKGNFVANGASLLEASDHWDGSTFPLSIPVPAATPGNVLALHLSYGSAVAGSGTDGYVSGLTVAKTGTEVSDPTQICYDEYWEYGSTQRPMLGNSVFMFDVASNGTGSTIDVDFTNNIMAAPPAASDGAFSWHWVEITSNDPNHSAADYGIKGSYGLPNMNETDGITTATAIDAGPCDGLHFAMQRHALGLGPYSFTDPQTDYFDGCYPGDWSENDAAAGYSELYHNVTFNATSSPCQVGSAAGFITGGSGPINYTHVANVNNTNGRESGGGCVIGLNSCEPVVAVPEETVDSEACTLNLPAPACDATMVCVFMGEGTITLDDGESVSIVPVINGGTVEADRYDLANTNGTFAFTVTIPSTSVAMGATPPPVSALIRVDFVGEGEVSITSSELVCTITPN